MKISLKAASVAMVAGVLIGAAAQAAEPAPLGTDTRAWLDLQKSPSAQANESRPVPGEVAERTYQRYVKSFDYPIPEQFKRESFKSSGGGGGGGGGGQ